MNHDSQNLNIGTKNKSKQSRELVHNPWIAVFSTYLNVSPLFLEVNQPVVCLNGLLKLATICRYLKSTPEELQIPKFLCDLFIWSNYYRIILFGYFRCTKIHFWNNFQIFNISSNFIVFSYFNLTLWQSFCVSLAYSSSCPVNYNLFFVKKTWL